MKQLIEAISLTKEQVRKINSHIYYDLFKKGSYYSNMLEVETNKLYNERKKYNSNIEFYRAVAKQFVNEYIPELISDYGDKLSEDTILKLKNIIDGNGLKVLNPNEAVELGYIRINENGVKAGDDGAFAIDDLGIIGFTPDSGVDLSNKTDEELIELSITNALRMKGSMIHETFHLITDVKLEERFSFIKNNEVKSKLTSGGFILNEGIVEKLATDFSLKHQLVHNPSLFYLHYVELCDAIEDKIGSEQFEQLALYGDYKQILQSSLSQEEIELYEIHERKKYFEKRGFDVSINEIILENNTNSKNINI